MTPSHTVEYDGDLADGAILRRYLDLPKYLDLLRTGKLYLQRADRFTDRFEGALTPAFREATDTAHRRGELPYNADEFYRRSRIGTYVNCWSLGAKDNMALWQLYGGASNSVAITTTVQRLTVACLEWNESVLIHKVRYIDHFKSPDMIVGRLTDILQFKHVAYDFEREVRILVPRQEGDWQNNPEAIKLPLHDLNTVIRSVVVAPEAETWFFDLIEDVTRRYNFTYPVRRSKLTYLPK